MIRDGGDLRPDTVERRLGQRRVEQLKLEAAQFQHDGLARLDVGPSGPPRAGRYCRPRGRSSVHQPASGPISVVVVVLPLLPVTATTGPRPLACANCKVSRPSLLNGMPRATASLTNGI